MCAQTIPAGFSLGLRDLTILDGTAPRNVTVSNIDGIYHDRAGAQPWGRLLVIETKRLDEQLRPGQRELLGALARIPDVTVAVLREGVLPGTFELEIPARAGWQRFPASSERIRALARSWWAKAPREAERSLARAMTRRIRASSGEWQVSANQ